MAATQWSAGEGVGLAIVRRLCALLDARIEVGTVIGEGTKFRITFGDWAPYTADRNMFHFLHSMPARRPPT